MSGDAGPDSWPGSRTDGSAMIQEVAKTFFLFRRSWAPSLGYAVGVQVLRATWTESSSSRSTSALS